MYHLLFVQDVQVPLEDLENANLIDLGMDSIAAAALWEKIAQIQGLFLFFSFVLCFYFLWWKKKRGMSGRIFYFEARRGQCY